MKNKISLILVFLILVSCGSGFSLQKKKSGDEFLVEKKNPLVFPPDYGKLPLPESQDLSIDQEDDTDFRETLIKDSFGKENEKKLEEQTQNNQNSLEKSILKKIK